MCFLLLFSVSSQGRKVTQHTSTVEAATGRISRLVSSVL
uniref:Uncharacterized protein n=1 Tax=Rhizophora mucronata TaxID=61149 RepID=A0A2P2LLR0_RHIMU